MRLARSEETEFARRRYALARARAAGYIIEAKNATGAARRRGVVTGPGAPCCYSARCIRERLRLGVRVTSRGEWKSIDDGAIGGNEEEEEEEGVVAEEERAGRVH